MVDWQVAATNVYCRNTADEVTIRVKDDWSVTCTGYDQWGNSRENGIELLKRGLKLKLDLTCKGIHCPLITDFVQKLHAEENQNYPVD